MNKLAQIDFSTLESEVGNTPANLGAAVSRFFEIATIVSGFLLVIFILFGGFKMLTAQGDPKKIQEARSTITNGVIGFAIIFSAFWIIQIIAGVLGLNSITRAF